MITTQTQPEAATAYAIAPDGTRIGAHRSGAGSPLVLVHGAASDGTRWAPVRAQLAERHTVYALDRRGRGLSGDAESYAFEREVEDVVAFVESLGEPAVLLGHSYGAMLALEAARTTEAVDALVLYEPPLPVGLPVYEPGVVTRLELLLARGDRDDVLTTFMREVPKVPWELIETMRGQATWAGRVAAAHTITRELRAANSYATDIRDRFGDLDVPTLLLIGGASPAFLTEPSRVLAATLPDPEVAVFHGHAHSAMDTATDDFVEAVLAFATRKESHHDTH